MSACKKFIGQIFSERNNSFPEDSALNVKNTHAICNIIIPNHYSCSRGFTLFRHKTATKEFGISRKDFRVHSRIYTQMFLIFFVEKGWRSSEFRSNCFYSLFSWILQKEVEDSVNFERIRKQITNKYKNSNTISWQILGARMLKTAKYCCQITINNLKNMSYLLQELRSFVILFQWKEFNGKNRFNNSCGWQTNVSRCSHV